MEIVFVRYGVQFLLISAVFLPRRGTALLKTTRPGTEIMRALFLLASTILNFFAILSLPLTVTASIGFTMPLMLCALSMPLLGEHVGWRRWTAVVVGFLGVLIIIRPGTSAFHPAVVLSLGAALMQVLYFVLTRRLAGIDSAATQQFYGGFVATACLAFFAMTGGWVWPHELVDWFFFALIGAAAFTGHMIFSTALRFAPASLLAPFAYLQIIFMTLSSWLVFSEPPDIWVVVGAPVVVASGLYIWLRERRLHRTPSLEPIAD
jgi:drug/metabolite transporter (DMT)-like permease